MRIGATTFELRVTFLPTSTASQPLFLYSTAVSDVGTVRTHEGGSSFAGEHLIAMCDGMGGHAGGDTASSIAIRSLAHIEQDDTGGNVETISRMMETSVMAAHDAIVGKAKRERKLAGMGTTVTAVALVAGCWVIAHIGDSRAYLLRDGRLSRITCDHSYVQHLINTGRITEAEARNHPQRNVVMRVLGDFDIDPRPDISRFAKAHPERPLATVLRRPVRCAGRFHPRRSADHAGRSGRMRAAARIDGTAGGQHR